jgi:uncharacterized protein (TIRG00374 family)
MIMEKRLPVRKGVLFVLAGLSVFILYLYFFVGVEGIVGPEGIIETLKRANIVYYSLAFIAVLLSVTFYSLTWQHLLSLLSIKTAFRKTLMYVWTGIFIDILVPAESVSGEISRAYLLSKSTGENTGKVVASLVVQRILSMIMTLSGLIAGSTFLILIRYELPPTVLNFVIIVATYSAIATILVCYMCFKEQATWRIINWVLGLVESLFRGRWDLTRFRSQAQKILKVFHEGIVTLTKHPRGMVQPVIFSVATWFFEVLISLLVFASIGFNISLSAISAIIIVYSLTATVQAIPLGIPAEVGVSEIVMTYLYTILTGNAAISASATVLTRIVTVWFRFLIGYVAAQWVGMEILTGRTSK